MKSPADVPWGAEFMRQLTVLLNSNGDRDVMSELFDS